MEQEEEQKEGMVGKAARGGVGADMDTLRKVEELSKALCLSPSSGAGDHHQPAGLGLGLPPSRKSKIPACKAVAEAAQELADLLNEHDSCRVYLRQCGGLEALLKLVGSSEAGPETLVAAIGALQAACTNERTAAAAVSKGLYPALVLLLASSKESFGVKSAAALLLGNCAVDHDERKAVSAALAGALPQVLPLLGDQGAPPPSFQASLLVLLQNCAVEKTAQDAFVAAQAGRGLETGTPLGDVAALLSSTRSLLAERAASLLGNLLMDQRLREGGGRAGAVACRLLDHVVLQDRRAVAAPGDDVLLPSLAALNNCLLEADACRAVLEGGGERLTALAPHVGHSNPAVAGRAAGAVARLVRHKEGRDAFLGDTAALRGFVNALSGACGKLRGGNVRGGALAEVAGGCCRALAVALSTGGPGAACTAAEAGAIPALLEAIGTPEVPDAAAGNAALAISDIARGKEHLPALRDADAVARLVGCAHKRQDKNAKRNAAIALARIAQVWPCCRASRCLLLPVIPLAEKQVE